MRTKKIPGITPAFRTEDGAIHESLEAAQTHLSALSVSGIAREVLSKFNVPLEGWNDSDVFKLVSAARDPIARLAAVLGTGRTRKPRAQKNGASAAPAPPAVKPRARASAPADMTLEQAQKILKKPRGKGRPSAEYQQARALVEKAGGAPPASKPRIAKVTASRAIPPASKLAPVPAGTALPPPPPPPPPPTA